MRKYSVSKYELELVDYDSLYEGNVYNAEDVDARIRALEKMLEHLLSNAIDEHWGEVHAEVVAEAQALLEAGHPWESPNPPS